MIRKLILKNFRSHRNQTIQLHPGINGFIGISQSGKTNIIRALIWLIYNRPSGNKYHSTFSRTNSKTKVSVLLDNDYTVSLEKSKHKNIYRVEHPEYGFSQYSKFGTQVPDLVKDKLNISELNIQNQIDRIFLAASSPPEIARTINKITKTEDIEKWIKNINSKTNNLKNHKDGIVDNIANIKQKLSGFEHMHLLDKKLSKLSILQKKIDKLDHEYMDIETLSLNIKSCNIKIKDCKRSLEAKEYIEKILLLQKKIDKLDHEYMDIENYLAQTDSIKSIEQELATAIEAYADELKKKKTCPVCFSPIKNKDVRRIINAFHSS